MTSTWHVSEDCKATLLLCHEFGGRLASEDAKSLTVWEYGQLVRFLRDLERRPADLLVAETAEPILRQLPLELPADRVRSLLARGLSLSLSIEAWRSRGIWVISRADPNYPSRLKDRFKLEAPPVLFGVGVPAFLNDGGLGVFGSRNVDAEGEAYAKNLGIRCAEEEMTILSGCARGVDWAAMSGCLEEGGRSIGVIAEKLDRAAVSSQYREFIRQERLVLISMFSPESPFTAFHAKGRDKYTYALSDYGVVVSAEVDKGGTWAGATEQLKRLRHVPVLVRSEGNLPAGNRPLLQMGARPMPKLESIPNLRALLQSNGTQDASIKPPLTVADPREEATIAIKQPEFALEASNGSTTKSGRLRRKGRDNTEKPPDAVLAEFARALVSKHLGERANVREAAQLLGITEEQAQIWIRNDGRH